MSIYPLNRYLAVNFHELQLHVIAWINFKRRGQTYKKMYIVDSIYAENENMWTTSVRNHDSGYP